MAAEENMVLQGACYVFGNTYIKNQNQIFFPMESFYFEEYFVFADCPRIQVIHNESSATKKAQPNKLERKQFKLKNLIESMNLYCEVYKDAN